MALQGPTQNWPGMHRRSAMNAHLPDALMQGWEPLVTGIVLPTPTTATSWRPPCAAAPTAS
jgi:hypothetical protein